MFKNPFKKKKKPQVQVLDIPVVNDKIRHLQVVKNPISEEEVEETNTIDIEMTETLISLLSKEDAQLAEAITPVMNTIAVLRQQTLEKKDAIIKHFLAFQGIEKSESIIVDLDNRKIVVAP